MALSLSNSATTNSCGRVTNKRKSSDGAWLRELASVVAGVTDTTLTATVSVDDALTPSSKQRSGSGTDDDMGTSIDHQILGSKYNGYFVVGLCVEDHKDSSDADNLIQANDARLRKRSRRGQDFTLKKAISLLRSLKSTYQQMVSGARAHDCADSSSLLESRLQPDLVASPWPIRAFIESAQPRYIAAFTPLTDPVLVDCNLIWCSQMQLTRGQAVGRHLSTLLASASWGRFTMAVRLAVEHGAVIVRNVPAYKARLVGDLLIWIEYQHLPGSQGRVPKFMQLLAMHTRPLGLNDHAMNGPPSIDCYDSDGSAITATTTSSGFDSNFTSHSPSSNGLNVASSNVAVVSTAFRTLTADSIPPPATCFSHCTVYLPMNEASVSGANVFCSQWHFESSDGSGSGAPLQLLKRTDLIQQGGSSLLELQVPVQLNDLSTADYGALANLRSPRDCMGCSDDMNLEVLPSVIYHSTGSDHDIIIGQRTVPPTVPAAIV